MFWYDSRLSLRLAGLPESFDIRQQPFLTLHPSVLTQLWIPDVSKTTHAALLDI